MECYEYASGSVDVLALALESQTSFRIAMVMADKGVTVLAVSCSGSWLLGECPCSYVQYIFHRLKGSNVAVDTKFFNKSLHQRQMWYTIWSH